MYLRKQILNNFQQFLEKWNFLVTKEQLDRLSINYWENPVKKGKLPLEQDLKYLLLDLNLSINCVADYFKVTANTIVNWCKKLNIHKSRQQIYELTKILNLRKYGVENPIQLQDMKQKAKDYYKTAINTWTKKDPLKRQIAKDNKLNWIEFFTIEQFLNWFEQIE